MKNSDKKLMLEAYQALQDWITTYAPEFSSRKVVREAWKRISERGGTLYYAGELSQRLREAAEASEKTKIQINKD